MAMQSRPSPPHSSARRDARPPPPALPFRIARDRRVLHWVQTGEVTVIPAAISSIAAVPESAQSDDTPQVLMVSPPLSTDFTLLGPDDDILRPTIQEAVKVFNYGQETWLALMNAASALPKGHLPPAAHDISIMLQDVPALPEGIPKHGNLSGHPVWRTATVAEASKESQPQDGQSEGPEHGWNSHYRCGARKDFKLSHRYPVEFRILPGPSQFADDPFFAEYCQHYDIYNTTGHLVLTLCWSYILSVRLYELQGKSVSYSHQFLSLLSIDMLKLLEEPTVHVPDSASRDLFPWLRALLGQEPGWEVDDRTFAPWSASCRGDRSFPTLYTTVTVTRDGDSELPYESLSPPSSSRAMELLVELCELYDLGRPEHSGDGSDALSPYKAAFLTALAIPFYRFYHMEPRFAIPVMNLKTKPVPFKPIEQKDVLHYMTLSMDPACIGSVAWSIFWQPDIECNVVGPWLTSILNALRPALTARDRSKLAQVFTLRRPRVGLWWVGILHLGNDLVLHMIIRYLETLEEQWGCSSIAFPDRVAASWSGEPQSFFDSQDPELYPGLRETIPVAELLRQRHIFRLRDTSSALLSWRPFGHVPKTSVEQELWHGLANGSLQFYNHWVWWIDGRPVVGNGFRHPKDSIANTPDSPEAIHDAAGANSDSIPTPQMKAGPSITATQRMMNHCMNEANGDRDYYLSIIPGAKKHRWLNGWRGFD